MMEQSNSIPYFFRDIPFLKTSPSSLIRTYHGTNQQSGFLSQFFGGSIKGGTAADLTPAAALLWPSVTESLFVIRSNQLHVLFPEVNSLPFEPIKRNSERQSSPGTFATHLRTGKPQVGRACEESFSHFHGCVR